MISFKFIETFFLLSLAITFALIVTFVYHFKKRMENMETKCDTMFDIVQNLAKEVLDFKRSNCIEQVSYETLDDVAINNQPESNNHESDNDESVNDESDNDESDTDESDNDESDNDESDNDESDNDESDTEIVINNLSKDKITIPNIDITVIDLSDQVTQSTLVDDGLVIFVENDTLSLKLNASDLSSIDNIVDESEFDLDDAIKSNLTKSALRKLKLAQLRQIAKGKDIEFDDAMTKNAIIDVLLLN